MDARAKDELIRSLRRRGFDKCRRGMVGVKVGCSQCEALVINGVACHETGCPNTKKDSNQEDES